MTEIYLNDQFIGNVKDSEEFLKLLITERRSGIVNKNVNIYFDEKSDAFFIESSKGRLRRPLIIIKDGKSLLTEKQLEQIKERKLSWDDLINNGIVEYIDAAEEENTLIALNKEEITKEHTHLEIDPIVLLGLSASLVPFGNHTQGARLLIGTKNQKQAMGLYATNYPIRIDTDLSLLHYSQRPLVRSFMHDVFNYDEHPSGQNFVVAVTSYEGYNMDDAIVLNKASLERGLGRSTYFIPVKGIELRYSGGLSDTICIPDKEVKGYKSERDYKLLEEDGIIYPEANVGSKDVIIGKTSPPKFLSNLEEYSFSSNIKRESSVSLPHGSRGVVDFVVITESAEGNKMVQVRLRDQRIPEIGDKFTSRHGQKGVIGMVIPQTDLPFSASGIIPDLVFSPQGIPSRMTISHLLELIGAKVAALSGRYVDGTTFNSEKEEELRKELLDLGFRENGTETFYDGKSGRLMKAKLFVGNMYYLRLRYMVLNKLQARATGPIQLLTRQPTEGKAKEGGLRLGEMEKEVLVAHGASLLLKERFDSDKVGLPICEKCGSVAIHDRFKDKLYCPIDGDNVEINYINTSYAFKLLMDELMTLGVSMKLKLETKY